MPLSPLLVLGALGALLSAVFVVVVVLPRLHSERDLDRFLSWMGERSSGGASFSMSPPDANEDANDEPFFFGTSTAAAQIESASAHNWRGFKASDGALFQRTSDHEKRRAEDVEYIAYLGSAYRFSLDWARLQRAPYADLDAEVVAEYLEMVKEVRRRGVRLMLVLHHFCEPLWFSEEGGPVGGWGDPRAVDGFGDWAAKVVAAFGEHATWWNTFNEPNVYLFNGWMGGSFPPQGIARVWTAEKALRHMGQCHVNAARLIHQRHPDAKVGISLNTCLFAGEGVLGRIMARVADWWFHWHVSSYFEAESDFQGISYYTKLRFTPAPLSEIDCPGKMEERGIPHDDMWEYEPRGMLFNVVRLARGKPVIITETGSATTDCSVRIGAIKDYLWQVKQAMQKYDVDVRGMFHWSTIDNFEWALGRAKRFGLVRVAYEDGTFDRTLKRSGYFYHLVAKHGGTTFDWDKLQEHYEEERDKLKEKSK